MIGRQAFPKGLLPKNTRLTGCVSDALRLPVALFCLTLLLSQSGTLVCIAAAPKPTGNKEEAKSPSSLPKTGAGANKANPQIAQPLSESTPAAGKGVKQKAADLKAPKPILDEATRLQIQSAGEKLSPEDRKSLNHLSEVLHEQDRTIDNELRDEETEALSNIGMLWAAAVERSGTIRYAIEKLSRRDATGKPVANDNFSKRMLQSLVHLGGVAGTMWTGTPASMIGSNMVSGLMSGDPRATALSQVTDADMVLLAKEVDNLQTRLITLYYNYRHAQERAAMRKDASSVVSRYFDHAMKSSDATSVSLQPLMQSMEETALQEERSAQQALSSARTELSLLVGEDVVNALDKKPEKTEDTKNTSSK